MKRAEFFRWFGLNADEAYNIKIISRSVPFTQHEIFKSYKLLNNFDLVEKACEYSLRYGGDLQDSSSRVYEKQNENKRK